jgi:hypothetical protein
MELSTISIVFPQGGIEFVERGHDLSIRDDRPFSENFRHEAVHVLEFLYGRPKGVFGPPLRFGIEPNGEGFCKVLVGVTLSVAGLEMHDVPFAIGFRGIAFRVGLGRATENAMSPSLPSESIGIVDGVARFVTEDAHTPVGRPSFDFEHLRSLELHEPWMGHVKRYGKTRHAIRREPIVGKPGVREKFETAFTELETELFDPFLQGCIIDRYSEIAETKIEKLVLRELSPKGRIRPVHEEQPGRAVTV